MEYEQYTIELHNANLVLLKAPKGYIMCRYLDLDLANELGDAAAVVTGVSKPEDALTAVIISCTKRARELGVCEGMTGQEALGKMQ